MARISQDASNNFNSCFKLKRYFCAFTSTLTLTYWKHFNSIIIIQVKHFWASDFTISGLSDITSKPYLLICLEKSHLVKYENLQILSDINPVFNWSAINNLDCGITFGCFRVELVIEFPHETQINLQTNRHKPDRPEKLDKIITDRRQRGVTGRYKNMQIV